MSGKAAVVKSLLEMGVQVDSKQTQSRLENQLDKLRIQRCLDEASPVDLINLCRKYNFDTRRSQERKIGKLLMFYQKNKENFHSDFPSPPSAAKNDGLSAVEGLDSAGLPRQEVLDSAGLPGQEVRDSAGLPGQEGLGSSGTGNYTLARYTQHSGLAQSWN